MMKSLCGFFAFFGIIHLFYAPIVEHGAMFGTWDSWGNLAMFHEVRSFLKRDQMLYTRVNILQGLIIRG